ncbi:MAG: bifunctional DNA primase/polymerase [Rhodococcus sp. (in: high G+C Gram-positive bacteria)]|uniref:bifunctional DNA primase/polymerase n=1 Tax=Rhodococcus sp. TaxID=1831 RepID=UPI00120156A0|nr:bifunctional DNA primase/polymerase [Rhodococcus sp. (in: high G+C Gram-positive bacteria)]RZL22242.1 MAG: bifunctional DNA primase/polymerase [Rhodococcus sp. (in: high G+C Gram-positive bacteria)]
MTNLEQSKELPVQAEAVSFTPANDIQRMAAEYRARGYWPVPVRDGVKSPKLRGYIGYQRKPDTEVLEDIESLQDGDPIGISLPVGVIAIDVDTYTKEGADGTVTIKAGGTELARLEAELGPLPKGVYSTRRGRQPLEGPERSAQYFFQLPPEAFYDSRYPKLTSVLAPNIETIQYHERFAMAAPTVLDGMAYQFYAADGTELDMIPAVEDLPVLPMAWFNHFKRFEVETQQSEATSTVGQMMADAAATEALKPARKARTVQRLGQLTGASAYDHMDVDEAERWASATIRGWSDEPNDFMRDKVDKAVATLRSSGCRHDDARNAIHNIVQLAAGGETRADGTLSPANPGGAWAVGTVGAELIRVREQEKASSGGSEAARLIVGALGKLRHAIDTGTRRAATEMFGVSDLAFGDVNGETYEWLTTLNGDDDQLTDLTPNAPLAGEFEDVPSLDVVHNGPTATVTAPLAPEPVAASSAAAPFTAAIDEPAFWASRPILAHIHAFARARLVSPWAVLGNVMVNAVAAIPADQQMPAITGSRASLNMFVAIVAESGVGKGGAAGAARDAIDLPVIERIPVGSGEGISKIFGHRTKASKSAPSVVERLRWEAVLTIDEVGTLAAVSGRSGATILPELCKVYSGEQLGRANMSDDRTIPIPAHEYRLCAVVGVQPMKSAVLFEDADGGTPQRFLFLPANDPTLPPYDPTKPVAVAPAMLPNPLLATLTRISLIPPLRRIRDIEYPAEAVAAIKESRYRALRGELSNALDGHALQTRLKVMCALAFLDGKVNPDVSDWELSAVVMEKSNETRARCEKALRDASHREIIARGRSEGTRSVVADDVKEKAAHTRVSKSTLIYLDDGAWHRSGKVRSSLRSTDRGHFDVVLPNLIRTGQIETRPNPAGRGEQLRKAPIM